MESFEVISSDVINLLILSKICLKEDAEGIVGVVFLWRFFVFLF